MGCPYPFMISDTPNQVFRCLYAPKGVFLLPGKDGCGIVNTGKESQKMKMLYVKLSCHSLVIPTTGLTQELIKAEKVIAEYTLGTRSKEE